MISSRWWYTWDIGSSCGQWKEYFSSCCFGCPSWHHEKRFVWTGCDLRFKINQTIIIQDVEVVLSSHIKSYFETSTGISISCIIKYTYNVNSQSLLRGFTPPHPELNSLGNPRRHVRSWGKSKSQKMLQLSWCSHRSSMVWNSHHTAPFHTEMMRWVGERGVGGREVKVVQQHRELFW